MTDTTLAPGSIAFTGFSSAFGPTSFNFVALVDLQAGQTITFTDNNHYDGQVSGGENTWTWTASADIAAGTVVSLDDMFGTPSSNLGSMTVTFGEYGFDNDVIFAYTGSDADPHYVTALSSYPYVDMDHILAGTGLQQGVNMVTLQSSAIGAYQGPTSGFSTLDDYKAALFDGASWATQVSYNGDPTHDGTAPDLPLSTAPFTADPSVQTVGFAAGSRVVSQVEGQPGDANVLTFVVTRSGSTVGALDFHGVLVIDPASGIDAADFGGTLPTFSGTIADGATSATITIPITADIHFEGDESFQIKLDSATNTEAATVIGASSVATATIVNDDVAQTVRFADDSLDMQVTEGDSGLKTITFTVVRDGSTLGDLHFKVQYQGGLTNADDFGGTEPNTFEGVILDGQTTGTFSLQIAGDTRYEDDEYFQLVLTSVSNDPVGAVVDPSYGTSNVTILNDDTQPTTIAAGEVAEGRITITGQDHFTIGAGARLDHTGDSAMYWTGTGTTPVIDNYGVISGSSYALEVNSRVTGNLTINNHDGAFIVDELRITGLRAGQTVTINNAGVLGGSDGGYAVEMSENGGVVILNNLATGVITQSGPGADVLKNGTNGTLNNWGRIISPNDEIRDDGELIFGGDAWDLGGPGDTIHNYAGGIIEGSRHAITGTSTATIINEAGGTMIGRNGSAANFDNDADPANALYVTNHGTMLGESQNYGDSDGDAIDADGLAYVDNDGVIMGMGHNGYHKGEPNISEGLAIGGGVINNYLGGMIYGYGRAIQVDDSSNGPALAATTIYNEGTIQGAGHGPTGVDPEDAAAYLAKITGREAIDILGSFADTITNKGTILGGVFTDGGDDTFTQHAGATLRGLLDLGDGNDTLTNGGAISGSVQMGAGDDTINLLTGSIVGGTIDGGDGIDTLNLSGTVYQTLGTVANVEKLDVQSGTWTIWDASGYSGITVEAGATAIVTGAAGATAVAAGGTEFVYGTASGSVISGVQFVQSGSIASDTTINSGGEQDVYGTASGTTVAGAQIVYGTVSDTTVENGGLQQVILGTAAGTTIDDGGQQNVYAGGNTTGTIVNAGANQVDWGNATDTTIDGGNQYVWGTASNTSINSGAQYVGAGGAASDTTIGTGGAEIVLAGGAAHNVIFGGESATLALEDSSALTGSISGWQANDRIDLGDILFSDGTTSLAYAQNGDNSGGTLTVSDGTHSATLNLLGQYSAADFAIASDGHGGTSVFDPSAAAQQAQLAVSQHA
jgi:autotransporter passenger strand-loop-strand repeat protein